ncbi:ferredoxin like protein [Candidatus Gastranaerophilus sp. (ex Termes propinquus)]|nr:ferredoxin like protein [Candidatus Gastranaerophilus sp. (ex Termes propinquus)]
MDKSIQDKLSTVKYKCSKTSHLGADDEKCICCKVRACEYVCPAGVWSTDAESKKSIIEYENCLECGGCRIACPYGAVIWEYPEAGCGSIYKKG